MGILRKEAKTKTQSIAHQSTDIVLDRVNNEIDARTPKPGWIQSDIFTLYECDKTITESGRWLTDEIINSSQLILAKQFQDKFLDAGLQNSVLGQLLCFAVQQQEFV